MFSRMRRSSPSDDEDDDDLYVDANPALGVFSSDMIGTDDCPFNLHPRRRTDSGRSYPLPDLPAPAAISSQLAQPAVPRQIYSKANTSVPVAAVSTRSVTQENGDPPDDEESPYGVISVEEATYSSTDKLALLAEKIQLSGYSSEPLSYEVAPEKKLAQRPGSAAPQDETSGYVTILPPSKARERSSALSLDVTAKAKLPKM